MLRDRCICYPVHDGEQIVGTGGLFAAFGFVPQGCDNVFAILVDGKGIEVSQVRAHTLEKPVARDRYWCVAFTRIPGLGPFTINLYNADDHVGPLETRKKHYTSWPSSNYGNRLSTCQRSGSVDVYCSQSHEPVER